MNINIYHKININTSFKYIWISFVYLMVFLLLIISITTKVVICNNYLAYKNNDIYSFYIENTNYNNIKNNIYVNNKLVKDLSYEVDSVYVTGYIKVNFKFESDNNYLNVNLKIIEDTPFKIFLKYMKGEK